MPQHRELCTAGWRTTSPPWRVRLLVNELTVDPFPFGLDYFLLTNCKLAGRKLDICYNVDRKGELEPGYRVYLDDEIVRRSEKPTAWQTLL
jgi:hypothetical protein